MAMSSAMVNLIGIERSLQFENRSVFDDLVLPSNINKEILKETIILRGGFFELLYSDPDFLSYSIAAWGRKYYDTFERWYESLQMEYNPIENYDRFEDYTDEHDGSNKSKTKSDSKGSNKNKSKNTLDGTQKEQVSGYNSSDFTDRNKIKTDDETNIESDSEYKDDSNINNEGSDHYKNNHHGRLHGNIGVTTSQQMLTSEIELREKFNIYDMIALKFVQSFCLMVY